MKRLLLLALLLAWPARAEEASDVDQILSVIDRFFTAQRERNLEVWEEVMLEDGMIVSNRELPGHDWVLNARTFSGDMERLQVGSAVIDERIYDPTVLVHRTIATVWAPYDIYVDERLLHCGIDVFQLFKVEGKWRISHFSYTTEPEGCDALGIPVRAE